MLVLCQWSLKNNDENLVTSIGLTMIGVRQAGSHVSEMLRKETRRDKTTITYRWYEEWVVTIMMNDAWAINHTSTCLVLLVRNEEKQ